MSGPYNAEPDSNAGKGTSFDEESGLAGKTLDAFRPSATVQDGPTYIVGPGSMPQQPDQKPWFTDGK
jgi:hypothetical protein